MKGLFLLGLAMVLLFSGCITQQETNAGEKQIREPDPSNIFFESAGIINVKAETGTSYIEPTIVLHNTSDCFIMFNGPFADVVVNPGEIQYGLPVWETTTAYFYVISPVSQKNIVLRGNSDYRQGQYSFKTYFETKYCCDDSITECTGVVWKSGPTLDLTINTTITENKK